MKKITLMLFALVASFGINAQQLEGNTDAPVSNNNTSPAERMDPVLITQSIDPETVNDGGVACWNSGTFEYSANSFWRSYDLTELGITNDVVVSSVEYGQGSADEGKEIVLNLYTADNVDLSVAVLTLIGTATHISTAADDLSLVSVEMEALIPAGSIVAFEVHAADGGTATDSRFFPGLNSAGENAPSYLQAVDCGVNVPTPVGEVTGVDEFYVMNIVGDDVLSVGSNLLSQVSIYPNPTSGILNLKMPASVEVKSAAMFDILGKNVGVDYSNGTINMSSLSQGVYLLKVETSAGTLTQKIVKQ